MSRTVSKSADELKAYPLYKSNRTR